jgi:hypothetical protein
MSSIRSISSFKFLYSLVFKNKGDLSQIPDKVKKTALKCFVKESSPYFLVTDDYFYIPCYFTKKAIDQFKSQNSNVNVTDLRSRVIIINDWSLELARVKSENVFTSYAGVELKLIVNSFKVDSPSEKISLNRHPSNIYRDNEMKTLINQYVHSAQSSTIETALKSESLPDISKFSGKGNVSQGVVKFAPGEDFTNFGFKEGKTAVLDSNDLLKLDKGASVKTAGGVNVKPKVVNKPSLKTKKQSIKKADIAGLAGKIVKHTPVSKAGAEKVSVKRVGPKAIATPGAEKSSAQSTDLKTMRQFKRLVAQHKKGKSLKKK